MRASFYLVSLGLAASAAVAQADLTQLPKCAESYLGTSYLDTGCNPIDYRCICTNEGFISGLSCCISKQCSPADQQTSVNFANNICRQANVEVPQSASCASSAAPASSTPAPEQSFFAQTTMPTSTASSTPGFLLPPIVESVYSSGFLPSGLSSAATIVPTPSGSSSGSAPTNTSSTPAPSSSAPAPSTSAPVSSGAAAGATPVPTSNAAAIGQTGELTGLAGVVLGALAFFY